MTSKLKKIKKLALSSLKGFTLVETLVAVLILMTAIAGPLTIASKGLQVTLVAKDQDTAFYLAQDAIEYIRYARDTNRLNGNDWLIGPGGNSPLNLSTCEGASGCYFDSLDQNPTYINPCPVNGCTAMMNNPTNADYDYVPSGGTQSIFTRTVQIIVPVGIGGINDCSATGNHGCEAIASTTVSWSDQAGITRRVQVREDIFNWQ